VDDRRTPSRTTTEIDLAQKKIAAEHLHESMNLFEKVKRQPARLTRDGCQGSDPAM
jgi:hypothetical protein